MKVTEQPIHLKLGMKEIMRFCIFVLSKCQYLLKTTDIRLSITCSKNVMLYRNITVLISHPAINVRNALENQDQLVIHQWLPKSRQMQNSNQKGKAFSLHHGSNHSHFYHERKTADHMSWILCY